MLEKWHKEKRYEVHDTIFHGSNHSERENSDIALFSVKKLQTEGKSHSKN